MSATREAQQEAIGAVGTLWETRAAGYAARPKVTELAFVVELSPGKLSHASIRRHIKAVVKHGARGRAGVDS
ncbi:MAG: hypothetical protein JO168_18315 [Solirubrobacterales bacterium]|nr:hypothetical protein [Solirubrobacterales bacterium]